MAMQRVDYVWCSKVVDDANPRCLVLRFFQTLAIMWVFQHDIQRAETLKGYAVDTRYDGAKGCHVVTQRMTHLKFKLIYTTKNTAIK